MKGIAIFGAIILLGMTVLLAPNVSAGATKVPDFIWAEDELFGSVLTPAGGGKGPAKSFDALYVFGGGPAGQRPIAEAAPGDRDYNGGRWQVFPVTFTTLGIAVHDADGDGVVNFELKSDTQLMAHVALGHFTIAGSPVDQFVCPLVPAK